MVNKHEEELRFMQQLKPSYLGFTAVNRLSQKVQPEDKVGLRCHKSLAIGGFTFIIGPQSMIE